MNNREAIAQIEGMRFQVQSSLDEVEVDVDSKEAEEDNRKLVEAFDMAIKALEQIEWIPVTEGLPEKSGMYLVTRKANYPQKCRGKMYQVVTYAYYNTSFKTWNTNGYPNVVAWKPLPEPYKED